jgi:hypothetical protein
VSFKELESGRRKHVALTSINKLKVIEELENGVHKNYFASLIQTVT